MYLVDIEESTQLLSRAIVQQACEDYIILSEQISRSADMGKLDDTNESLKKFSELVAWFKSEEFRSVSTLKAEYLLTALDEAIRKGETDGIKGKKRLLSYCDSW